MTHRMKPGDQTEHRVFYCPEAAGIYPVQEEAPSKEPPSKSSPIITLDGEEAHHAIHVLRVRPGETVRLFDGLGFFYDGIVADIAKKSLSIKIESRAESQAEPCARLILMVGYLKGRALDFLIQKSVEIGVSDLVLFQAERSVAKIPSPLPLSQREREKKGLSLSRSESSLQASSQREREKKGLPLSCSESSLQASLPEGEE